MLDRILYPTTECAEYRITVVTGDFEESGMTSIVYITLHGDRGESDQFFLHNGTTNFAPGQTSYFTLFTRDVGELSSVRIRFHPWLKAHDFVPHPWYLSTVSVQNRPH